jgi:hypothetical protein
MDAVAEFNAASSGPIREGEAATTTSNPVLACSAMAPSVSAPYRSPPSAVVRTPTGSWPSPRSTEVRPLTAAATLERRAIRMGRTLSSEARQLGG